MKQLKDDASPSPPGRRQSLDGFLFSKDRYKLFALAALLLLAVWSMFTGTLTLKSSAGDASFSAVYSSSASSSPDDLDVLEVVEREKLVKKLWSLYIHGYGGLGSQTRLPRFWEEAFQAAYESLVSDAPQVRDDAFTEIAKMSLSSLDLLLPPPTTQSTGAGETGKTANSRKLKTG